ncbi:uncharacterized protein LOC127253979 [Andrographis paniculata]|uniref:uncharacterized protein LOC127253979 n=1 Tax=Andrographis paniculata TaxID=175694 RepID=UPI0021E77CBF|nr:uncharacterized protein LOC127253979 [Andrographis paniculata]
MDFDEIEYLESTVENPELKKSGTNTNGGDGGAVEHGGEKRRKSSRYSSDEDGDDLNGISKRSRNESDDREKDRSSRYREKDKGDKDRRVSSREHRNREKEEGSGNERSRDRGRDRDRERGSDKRRDGNRERREREHGRERDKEDERERSKRSRHQLERSTNGRPRERSRDVEVPDKDHKERHRDKEFRDQDQENRKHREKKEEAVQPEADPERDQRTVFAYQISLKAGERDVYEFFSRAGKVRDVQLIMDRNTRRSRGVGYIEFYDVMSVPMAIALSGQPLLGQPVMVKPSEAEKNLVQSTTAVSNGGGLVGQSSGEARKLYVGNLPITIKEDQIRLVFESFGTVELVQMPVDPGTGNCKGYAFVQFSRLEDAKAAQNLNGQLEIAGRVIKVSAVTDQVGMQDAGAKAVDFDDDEGSGLSLNAQSRALLMQKLDRTGAASSMTGSSAAPVSVPVLPGLTSADLSMPALPVPSADTIGAPSECLLLKNMFDPNLETEPDFDLDIKEDVSEECSKFGKLKHIHVDKNSAGFVYLRFENAQSAIAAQRALHGRWFAGKMITATFMTLQNFEAKFPDSS